MASHRSRSVAPAAGSSQARSVTSAPIAAPSPIGSRPSRRTIDVVRGFAFDVAVRPPLGQAVDPCATGRGLRNP